ncbi:M23 family metallopeptidase [Nannocystis sp. SCPEA4]|uniref:M23 family metallopeptidase n=1 Tax=Nannocystis sp. SCPEA4 TaxID=2996787 RepID=UPI00226DDCAA|nr:M23 family metallopeptidase [Nannocystis sp. SCPEA4]MCY1057627.1 M23 family metallopeptidase [Nannocystis sp. SCPEA4]
MNYSKHVLFITLCTSLGACDEGPGPDGEAAPGTTPAITEVAEFDRIVDAEADGAFAGFAGTDDAPDVRVFAPGEMSRHLAPETADLAIRPTPILAAGEIAEPAGYGHYCSMTWSGGGWAYAWDTNGGDPCAYLIGEFGAGTIRKAGLFSAAGGNQAVVWCDGQTWGPAVYRGAGGGPLTAAFNASVAAEEPNCVMTVSSMELPIFERPPASFSSIGTGIDFAREGAPTLDTGWFGAVAPYLNAMASQVNFKGHAKTGFLDDHDGWDWGAAENTDLYALTDGKVIVSRDYHTSAVACATAEAAKVKNTGCINRDFPAGWPAACSSWSDLSPSCQAAIANGDYISYRNAGWDGFLQGEVYVRHKVVASPATYNESFVAGYYHVKRTVTPAVGTNVTKNTIVGDVGNGGWTTGPHLHLTVIRETNVGTPTQKDRWFAVNGDTCTNCVGGSHDFHRYAVDPFGWQAPAHADPRGWATKDGAMSPKLWKANANPPSSGDWGL